MLTGWLYTKVQDGKEYQLCELCNHKKLLRTVKVAPAPCTHAWNSGKVTKVSTYDAAGVKTYTCTKCGKTRTESIAKLVAKKGDVITIGKVKYKVKSSSAVSYVRTTSKAKKIRIPSSVTIGGKKYSVTSIAANAFKANKKITSVIIPRTVTTISAQAFYGCKALKKITIPASVKIIGKKAFYGCKALKKITIPASVKTIGKRAFYNCKKLKKIIIKTKKLTNKTVGAGAFGKINSKVIVKVPQGKLKTYKKLLKKKGITKKTQTITE